jgi:DivIVA domain-containing protein
MDVTPKAFRDVQFREKLRGGYHPEDVDEFLEQAALGVEVLLDRLQQATDQAQRAEQVASEANASDETLKRMLLLAQRTVDQAVKEANDDAERLLSKARAQADALGSDSRAQAESLLAEARAQAESLVPEARAQAEALVSDARAQAERLLSDAEERGRAAYEGHLAEGRASAEMASSAVQQAQQEAEALRAWVDANRAHLLAVLRDAEGLVGNASALVENAGLLSEPPTASAVAGSSWPGQPEEVTNPPGAPEEAAVAPFPEAAPSPAVAEDDEQPDPRLLEGPRAREVLPAPPAGPADNEISLVQGPADPGELVVAGPGGDIAEAGRGEGSSGEDKPLAFDERALDSFFSEQDLGDQRSTSRFRRRQ